MVSKRQRLAQRKYKQEHPDLFPKPEPTPPKDPTKKKKKKPQFKRKKSDSDAKDPSKPRKSSFDRRPLRIPGLKPGDSCFICKDVNHIAKNCPEKAEWERNKICLYCRQRGHSMKNCRNISEEDAEQKLCYNCGENGHSLSKCPLPLQGGGTKFAQCFICKERGHLSKDCPKNTHGIYPKGGCCKICGGVTHLARDCPDQGTRNSFYDSGRAHLGPQQEQQRPKVTKLFSGDDLEDDFMIEDDAKNKNDSKKITDVLTSDTNHIDTKVKKKEGTKVVNFVG